MLTVCIATYNGEKYIRQQLNSVLIQLGENDEVIISDDSSSDATCRNSSIFQ
ncbi:glycosyltransferase [Bacteroides fragilis]|nr:glycosyltransferase [Bacteroides fragilis]